MFRNGCALLKNATRMANATTAPVEPRRSRHEASFAHPADSRRELPTALTRGFARDEPARIRQSRCSRASGVAIRRARPGISPTARWRPVPTDQHVDQRIQGSGIATRSRSTPRRRAGVRSPGSPTPVPGGTGRAAPAMPRPRTRSRPAAGARDHTASPVARPPRTIRSSPGVDRGRRCSTRGSQAMFRQGTQSWRSRDGGKRLPEHRQGAARTVVPGSRIPQRDLAHQAIGLHFRDVQLIAQSPGQLERRALLRLVTIDPPRPRDLPFRVSTRRLAEVELLLVADRPGNSPLPHAARDRERPVHHPVPCHPGQYRDAKRGKKDQDRQTIGSPTVAWDEPCRHAPLPSSKIPAACQLHCHHLPDRSGSGSEAQQDAASASQRKLLAPSR